ncbi:MAG: hypothetical protein IT198_05330 [Acidimicrobiia bacterium]|nr:hypothetical protein [Acidimicrobiia bacterium]
MGAWPPAPAGFRAWPAPVRARVSVLLTAVLPPEELGGTTDPVEDFVGGFAATLPPARRAAIRFGLDLLWLLAPLVLLGRTATFGGLTQDERERLLERIAYSKLYPIRVLGLMLKSFAGLAVIGDPAVRRGLGIDPPTGPLPPLGAHVRWDEDIEGLGR